MKRINYVINNYKDLIDRIEYRKGNRIFQISKINNIDDIVRSFKKDYPIFSQYNNRDCIYILVMIDNDNGKLRIRRNILQRK